MVFSRSNSDENSFGGGECGVVDSVDDRVDGYRCDVDGRDVHGSIYFPICKRAFWQVV
ncbi:hypothetical protein D3C86_1891770 [compost metagenome]